MNLSKDAIILILRILSKFSIKNCLLVRLVATYVRHDVIISEEFKACRGFKLFVDAINKIKDDSMKGEWIEEYDFTQHYQFPREGDSIVIEGTPIELCIRFTKDRTLFANIKELSHDKAEYMKRFINTCTLTIITSKYTQNKRSDYDSNTGMICWSLEDDENAETYIWQPPDNLLITLDGENSFSPLILTSEIFSKIESIYYETNDDLITVLLFD